MKYYTSNYKKHLMKNNYVALPVQNILLGWKFRMVGGIELTIPFSEANNGFLFFRQHGLRQICLVIPYQHVSSDLQSMRTS